MLRNLILSTLLIGGLIFGGMYVFGDKNKSGIEGRETDNGGAETLEEIVPLGEGQSVEEVSRNENEYKHRVLGFSFTYPKDFSISSFGNYFDSAGETILLQKNGSGGLQILITPFDEDIVLTTARIKKDIPTLNITEAVESALGVTSVRVVIFKSNNNFTTGNSLEGWFVYRNQLYQISASATSGDLFDKIISTWEFK